MKNLLKSLYFSATTLLLLIVFIACSDTTNNSNQNTKVNTPTDTKKTENVNAAGITKQDCDRPLDIYMANDVFQTPGNYQLTYNWKPATNATSYEFDFLMNGTVVFQNLNVTDTTITFNQSVTALDSIYARVKTTCGTQSSTTSIESAKIIYLNAISTDDVVFLVSPSTSVDDICSRSCMRLKFTGNSLKNQDGSVIPLSTAATRVYYDFSTVKDCIDCKSGTAPLVNPAAFNACLRSPLNQLWLYDPNAHQVCP